MRQMNIMISMDVGLKRRLCLGISVFVYCSFLCWLSAVVKCMNYGVLGVRNNVDVGC